MAVESNVGSTAPLALATGVVCGGGSGGRLEPLLPACPLFLPLDLPHFLCQQDISWAEAASFQVSLASVTVAVGRVLVQAHDKERPLECDRHPSSTRGQASALVSVWGRRTRLAYLPGTRCLHLWHDSARWCSGVVWGSAYECVQPPLLARAQSQSFAAVEEGTQDTLGAPSVLWLVSAWCCPATSVLVKPWRLLLCRSLYWAYHPGKGTSQCVMIIMWSCIDCCLFIFSSVLYLCSVLLAVRLFTICITIFFIFFLSVCCCLLCAELSWPPYKSTSNTICQDFHSRLPLHIYFCYSC